MVISSRKPTKPIPYPLSTTSPTSTSPVVAPGGSVTPTLIPPRFTGADISQELPPEVMLFSEQKTELRRKAPFDLSFGTISFDYENDIFLLILAEPKDQSQIAFDTWLQQTYPALPREQFAIQ